MGQAKQRGNREARIAQAKANKQPPTPGVYVSTKNALGMRILVEDVTVLDDEEDNGLFLVAIIDEASADDAEAISDELEPEQWFELVDQYGLVRSDG